MLNIKNYSPEDEDKDEDGDWVDELILMDILDDDE